MLETYLPIANVVWSTDALLVIDPDVRPSVTADDLTRTGGRFATVDRVGDTVVMTRDKLGLNKLYFAIDARRGVVAANYLADLIHAGIGLDAIYAVPAGTATAIDLRTRTIRTDRHYHLPPTAGGNTDPGRHLVHVRDRLDRHIEAAAAAHPSARVAVCLSGGLDSGLIAALVRKHFTNVHAYTYAFDDHTGQPSPDAVAAERLASWLNIPFRLAAADADTVISTVPRAYRFGQDWRDFNLHCAIVNDILAEAIASDRPPSNGPALVFTGDLMNELLGDYTPIRYRGRAFYGLPNIPMERARVSLVRGLQCGDREVGVFAARNLIAVQPYGLVSDDLLNIPGALTKPELFRILADGLLPAETYHRPKARAQIGGPEARTGILPLLVDSGRLGTRLEHEFCDAVGLAQRALHGLIRAGVYRYPSHYPGEAP